MSADCIFCSIIAGTTPAWRVDEDDHTLAFLDIGQATVGHTLVVPKQHAADIWSITDQQATEVARAVRRVAALLHDKLEPEGMSVTQSNGAAAWQTVFHYHVHVIPRYPGDGLVPPWRSSRPSPEALEAVHHRITSTPG
jgi:histidine triad (HIT) family protein